MRISATTLESFRLVDLGVIPEADLIAAIKGEFVSTPRIELGRAFGKVLETPEAYEVVDGYRCQGHFFHTATVRPALAVIDREGALFEVKATRRYGAHTVVCKADHLKGARVAEFKTRIGSYAVEKYGRSSQWRFMADLLRPVSVTYLIFRLSASAPHELQSIEELPLYPYPQMHVECALQVDAFAAFVRRRGLEGYLPDRSEDDMAPGPTYADEPTFIDGPVKPASRWRAHAALLALPGEQRTPGTRRRWASGGEWAEHAEELAGRRGTRAKVYADQRAHLEALSLDFINAQGPEDLVAIRSALLNPQAQLVPPRGMRGGTAYERVITAVNDALARQAPRGLERVA